MTAFTCAFTDETGSLQRVSVILREYFGTDESHRPFHEREWTAWRLALAAGVPVPEVVTCGQAPEGPFAIMRRSPGRPLWPNATPRLVSMHAKMLAKLHTFDLTGQDFHALPRVTTTGRLEALCRISEEVGDNELAHTVADIVEGLRPASEPRPRLLHGDSHPKNVLTDGEQITCLVDWEGAYVADPRWDVAHTFLWLDAANRPDLADTFAQSYGDASCLDLGALPMWITAFETAMWANAAHLRMRMARGQPLPTTNIEGILREGDEAALRVRRRFKNPF
ncbi:MAG: phosphotransferase family protein [bacterium]